MKKENNKDCIINPETEKCNHDIKSSDTSIVILDSPRTFVYPERFFGICKYCGESFIFEKLEDGKVRTIKNKEDD
jgi:hypothetical protein